jgi:hypothetical protein
MVADAALYIGFGEVVRGREKRTLRNYQDAIRYWNGLQEEGRIASYDVTLLGPHAQLNGFIMVRGTDDQLDALRHTKEFRGQLARARLTLDHLVVAEAFTGARVAEFLGEYEEEVNQLD